MVDGAELEQIWIWMLFKTLTYLILVGYDFCHKLAFVCMGHTTLAASTLIILFSENFKKILKITLFLKENIESSWLFYYLKWKIQNQLIIGQTCVKAAKLLWYIQIQSARQSCCGQEPSSLYDWATRVPWYPSFSSWSIKYKP